MLNVYIDNSGSMSEMGKIDVAKYVARAMKNANFYLLNGRKIDLDSMTLNNTGSILETSIKNSEQKILLSDGLFKGCEKLFDIALAIGIDADVRTLEKMANKVYQIDEIMAFLEYTNTLTSSLDEDDLWE